MPQVNIIKCDICGVEKKEANHWWILYYNIETRSTFSFPLELNGDFIHETPCEDEIFICGLECLLLAESRIRDGKNGKRPR